MCMLYTRCCFLLQCRCYDSVILLSQPHCAHIYLATNKQWCVAGGKILLNNARLHLKRGKRYGLCGPNGAGKSTLMRSIANGQLDGFPPKDQLRTVYVEHDIDASESNVAVVEYVHSDPILQDASHPAHNQVSEVLGSVGFTETMQQAPVSSLSGGWKMKLALGTRSLCCLFSSAHPLQL